MQSTNAALRSPAITIIRISCLCFLWGCGGGGAAEQTGSPITASDVTPDDVSLAQEVASEGQALAGAIQQYIDTQSTLPAEGNAVSSTLRAC